MDVPNIKKDPVRVEHAALRRVTSDSPYKSRCPACGTGLLLVARHPQTLRLQREDACVSCGQRVIYTDKRIAGETPDPEKARPS